RALSPRQTRAATGSRRSARRYLHRAPPSSMHGPLECSSPSSPGLLEDRHADRQGSIEKRHRVLFAWRPILEPEQQHAEVEHPEDLRSDPVQRVGLLPYSTGGDPMRPASSRGLFEQLLDETDVPMAQRLRPMTERPERGHRLERLEK